MQVPTVEGVVEEEVKVVRRWERGRNCIYVDWNFRRSQASQKAAFAYAVAGEPFVSRTHTEQVVGKVRLFGGAWHPANLA